MRLKKCAQLYRKHARGNSLFRNRGFRNNQDSAFQDTSPLPELKWAAGHGRATPGILITTVFPISTSLMAWSLALRARPSRPEQFLLAAGGCQFAAGSQAFTALRTGLECINELIRADSNWSGFERNVFYANNRDGTFSDVSGAVGLNFLEDGRAFALADFDHDGRLEVFLKNRNGPQLRLLKNVMKDLPPSIAFRLRGAKSNRDAIGAAVSVETESGRQTRMLQAGSGFLSQHSKDVFFGLGEAKGPVRASIRWPSGLVQELHDLPLNHRIWVEEGSEPSRIEPFKPPTSVPGPPGLKPKSFVGPGGTAEQPAEQLWFGVAQRFSAAITSLVPMRASAPEVLGNNFPAVSEAAPFNKAAPQETPPLPTTVETWLLAPLSAPDFSLPDLTGQIRTLSALRGQAVLLNFWTTRSASCQQDLRIFNQLHLRWASSGLQLLTVNLDGLREEDPADAESVRATARELHLSFPILGGSDDVAGIYNILYRYLFDRHRDLGLPTSFLIDGKGDIVKVYQGPTDPAHVGQDFRQIPQTPAERLAVALPFPGVIDSLEFRRNYLSYGSVYFQRDYFDQAEASFRRTLDDDPSSAEALYGLGSVYLKQGKTAEARKSFEGAIKLHASYPDTLPNAWNNLGLLATREGHTAEAIPYFQEALRLSPDHLIALENLGNAYRQRKNWDEARKTLERAVEVGPQDPEANYSLGMVFAQLDDTNRAYEYLLKALKFRPGYPEALNNLGVLYLRTQRRDEAVASFEECIRVAPAFDQSYLNLARVYALEGASDKARAVLLELLKQHPDQTQGKKMLGELGR